MSWLEWVVNSAMITELCILMLAWIETTLWIVFVMLLARLIANRKSWMQQTSFREFLKNIKDW